MNIRCPSCQTLFRVDPARVPASGVRARCARCGNTFLITADQGNAAPAAAAPAPAQAAPRAPVTAQPMAAQPMPAQPMAAPMPAAPAAPPAYAPPPQAAAPAAPPQPVMPPRPVAPPPAAPASPPAPAAPAMSAGASRAPVFGSRDPNARAQRIARALVSDIVAYHGKRRDQFLAAGTLRTEFRDEIMKSWEEYVAQVGLDMAKSTPYFRDALNAILANGQNIF